MRKLVLMRGAQGSGKSTFIRNVSWEPYTLSADEIRLQIQGPVMGLDGQYHISSTNDRKVWSLLFNMLETRMDRGDFTVVDATHAKTSAMGQYKKLADKYRYRVYVIDFSDKTLEECLEGNRSRSSYQLVPEDVVANTVTRMHTERVPGWITVVKPSEWKSIIEYDFVYHDYSQYKAIHHFGDIHGCYDALKQYFKGDMTLKSDELYIFVGDYLDRGIQNGETLKWLMSIKDEPNVILLEGNHDRWLRYYANDEEDKIRNSGFLKYTKPQLEEAGIDKKDLRQFCRRFQQMDLYDYAGYRALVTHGGFPKMPNVDDVTYLSTQQFVQGVGEFKDDVDSLWVKVEPVESIQIHGHRNIYRLPVKNGVIPNSFNLEQQVEFGGNLAVVTITHDGMIDCQEIKNETFDKSLKKAIPSVDIDLPIPEVVSYMRQHDLIKERVRMNHISSFNFTREAFDKWQWDTISTKARGLFINTKTMEIVNRGYSKFFAIGESKETKTSNLPDILKFPIQGYVKENGYLGMVGYDSESNQLIYSSKSGLSTDEVGGKYALAFQDALLSSSGYDAGKIADMEDFITMNNVSLTFEVVLPETDPHIIKYGRPHVYLLDAVYREFKFRKMQYYGIKQFADRLGLEIKKPYHSFDTWAEFFTWYRKVSKVHLEELSESIPHIEGVVFEDQNQFMFKVKFFYYKFWKQMRNVTELVGNHHESTLCKGSLFSPLHNQFYQWLLKQDREYLKNTDIITLRDRFYSEGANK